jgi:hypothetical protein
VVGDIFREIDEELKQEDYVRLWKKYGNHVMAGVAAVLVVVAGIYGWAKYQESRRIEASNRYAEAQILAATGKNEEAAALFANLAEQTGGGYEALAQLQRAALRAAAHDVAGAVAIYQAVADDTGIARPLRDLATVMVVLHSLDLPNADAAALEAKIVPLDAAGGPWRHSARELRAVLAQKSGQLDRAKQLYTQLSDDTEAPAGIRARAAEMLSVLGG